MPAFTAALILINDGIEWIITVVCALSCLDYFNVFGQVLSLELVVIPELLMRIFFDTGSNEGRTSGHNMIRSVARCRVGCYRKDSQIAIATQVRSVQKGSSGSVRLHARAIKAAAPVHPRESGCRSLVKTVNT